MRQVYVDSEALVALLRPAHRSHRRMLGHFQHLLEQRDMLVTTDIAVAEAATALRRDPGLHRVVAFRDTRLRGRPLSRRARSRWSTTVRSVRWADLAIWSIRAPCSYSSSHWRRWAGDTFPPMGTLASRA